MQESTSIPNTTDREQPGEEGAKPVAPMWIFKVMNPIIKALLRPPWHLLGGSLMLHTYTGRRTGKQYTIPIGYFPWGEGEVMAFTTARWWTHLRSRPPVRLLLKGCRVQAIPTVIDMLAAFVRRLGPQTAGRLPPGLPSDREPTQEELRNVLVAAMSQSWPDILSIHYDERLPDTVEITNQVPLYDLLNRYVRRQSPIWLPNHERGIEHKKSEPALWRQQRGERRQEKDRSMKRDFSHNQGAVCCKQ